MNKTVTIKGQCDVSWPTSSCVNDDTEDEQDAKYSYDDDNDDYDDDDVDQVVPNVMCIALYSPPLDSIGNSVRGQQFCKVYTITIISIIIIVIVIVIITAIMIRSWWIFSIFTVLTT